MKKHTGDYLIHTGDRTIYVYTEALASMEIMREPTEAELAAWFKDQESELAPPQDLLGGDMGMRMPRARGRPPKAKPDHPAFADEAGNAVSEQAEAGAMAEPADRFDAFNDGAEA
jgi:hypothetical protein